MAVIKVVNKNSEIDGKPITWNVLAITSYIGGEFQTLELKLTKTEALLAGMLLNNTEEQPQTVSRKATDSENQDFLDLNNDELQEDWTNELKGKKK